MKTTVIGIGVMGEPIARNLLKAGMPVTVYSRTAARCEPLREAGAVIAATPYQAITSADAIVLMVPSHREIDQILERGADGQIQAPVSGKIVIVMATVAPAYSEALAADIEAA